MSIRAAFHAAREYRAEIIFGTLTGLMSSGQAPAPVALPRRAGSAEPQLASHFGHTIPQDTSALLSLLDSIGEGLTPGGEFDEPTGSRLYRLGFSVRRHGFTAAHFEPLATAISKSIDRHLKPEEDVSSQDILALKDAAYLACNIMAQGCAEAEESEREAELEGAPVNPPTARAKVVEIERPNPTTRVVRMQVDPPLMYAAGEPLMVSTPYTPLRWRPLFPALPCNPDGMLELHVLLEESGDAGQEQFLQGIINHAEAGDEWVLSTQASDLSDVPLGLRSDDPAWKKHADKDLIIVAEGAGLAPARAAILQQVFGGAVGYVVGVENEETEPGVRKPRRIHLIWGAESGADLYELDGLLGLARAFDWLRVTPVVKQADARSGYRTLLTEGDLREEVLRSSKYLDDHVIIVSGPGEQVEQTIATLKEQGGVPADQLMRIKTDWNLLRS